MTVNGGASTPDGAVEVVWESSALLHACRCDRADVLLHHADAVSGGAVRHVTTAAVAEELRRHAVELPARIEVVHVRRGGESMAGAAALLDTLILDGARYPFGLGGFATWAKAEGLLDA